MSDQAKKKNQTEELTSEGKGSDKSKIWEVLEYARENKVPFVVKDGLSNRKAALLRSLLFADSVVIPINQLIDENGLEILLSAKASFEESGAHPILVLDSLERLSKSLDFTLVEENKSPLNISKLTPQFLANEVNPYLAAIAKLQELIDEIQMNTHNEVSIRSIQQNSPISISLDGASEAVKLVIETIMPWKRKHSETMANLLENEKRTDIESKRAEILEKHANATKGRAEAKKLTLETEKLMEEVEKIKIENETLRLEFHRAKIQLALDVLMQIKPDLTETQKIEYVIKLIETLNILTSSNLTVRVDSYTPK